MLDDIGPLRDAGFALHWLKTRSKAPIEDKWSTAPVYSAAELRRKYEKGANLGVRLGEPSRIDDYFLHVLDVDIRDSKLSDEAFEHLTALVPGWREFPQVKSGSAGPSIHVHFLTEQPFRSRKLAHSEGFFVDSKGIKHWNWEIELFGTGKQVVLPPSIHPDTGQPYRWLRPFDFDLVGLGLGPVVSADLVAELAPPAAADDLDDDDAFLNQVRNTPTDYSLEQVRETIGLLPLPIWCEDRDGWLAVGMALHHQFAGADAGFDLWSDFSKQSTKFNPRDQRRVWKSFSTSKPGGTTFRTLIQAGEAERLRREAESDEIDDLIGSPGEAADPDAPKVEDWHSLLELNPEKTAYKPTLHNTVIIVRNDARTKGLPQLNLFTKEVVQRTAPGRHKLRKPSPKGCKQLKGPIWEVQDAVNGDLWTDVRDVAMRDVLEAPQRQGGYGIKLTDRDLKGAVNMVASESAFHPVREYLSGLRWDGRPRIDSLFVDYFNAPDTPYTRSVARLFLAAAVCRVFEPGHKFDFAVILEGIQGKRKTTFIEKLAKHWFSELEGDIHDTKAMVERMQGAWILELPELVGFSKADVRTIKAFISRRTDKVRLAYERRAAEFPRQCIFIGSTNEAEYLRDDTGGRRFWPIHCEVSSIDVDRLEREADQIWAEAHAVYRGLRKEQPVGTLPLYLSDTEAAAEAVELQEMRRVESAEEGLAGRIAEWLEIQVTDDAFEDETPHRRDVTCLLQIWVECLNRDVASYGQLQAQQLSRAMKKLTDWYMPGSRHRVPKWGQQRVYRRKEADVI